MSSEVEVSETPNWLKELEAKREKRLKVRLGHEAGAGAPCLKCGEKCPGLDLHFWRKCCKICKCSKEEHEVQDDDIYGWAQFQLLGSKPNKIKRKILLPGKKDELELDWAPKGHSDIVDKYLKTLPQEQLPIPGSQAAQDRKQLLQKQIPVHDVDPTLCHELNDEEMKKMNEYISHVKKSSVGVGQIVNLSSLIKGHLHVLNPSDAALIASRYPKGIPLSEIVKLQSQSRTDNLSDKIQKVNIHEKSLPALTPKSLISNEETQLPVSSTKIYDKNYPNFMNKDDIVSNPLHTSKLRPNQYNVSKAHNMLSPDNPINEDMSSMNEKFPYNPNFDPKKVPSQFYNQNILENEPRTSAFVPYSKVSNVLRPEAQYLQDSSNAGPNFTGNLPEHYKKSLAELDPANPNHPGLGQYQYGREYLQKNPNSSPNLSRNISDLSGKSLIELDRNNSKDPTLRQYPHGTEFLQKDNNVTGDISKPERKSPEGLDQRTSKDPWPGKYQYGTDASSNEPVENLEKIKREPKGLPSYVPGKHIIYSETQSPTKIPRNVKDLAFSTYDPKNVELEELKAFEDGINNGSGLSRVGPYRSGVVESSAGAFPVTNVNYPNLESYKNPNGQSADNLNSYVAGNLYGKGESCRDPSLTADYFANPELQHAAYPYGHSVDPNRPNKKLLELQPGKISIPEDFLHPSQVQVGAIQDINYPEIKAAMQGTNDFYEDYSPDSIQEILNNVKLPDCHYCKKPFEENEFAVTIERANMLFHAECFRCAGCNQILADNIYFYSKETNNVYCGRDYAKIRGFPRCKACDELIFTKEYCLAENSTFHLKHFCCTECDTPLAGHDYTIEEGMPYCLPCFEHSKASKCNACNKVIKPDEIGCNLNGVHFHAIDQCLACKICGKPLMGQKLLLRNQKLYCSHECFGADSI